MKQCVYDNPKTLRREVWQDGTLVYSIDPAAPTADPARDVIEPFEAGRIWWGSLDATEVAACPAISP